MAKADSKTVESRLDKSGSVELDERGCLKAKKGPDGADRKERRRLASIEYWTTQRDYDHEVKFQEDWADYPPHPETASMFNLMREYATHCSYIEAWHEMVSGSPSRIAKNIISQHVVYTKQRRQEEHDKQEKMKIDLSLRGEDLYKEVLSKGNSFNYTFGLVAGAKVAKYMEFMGLATKDQVKAVRNLESKVRVWDGKVEIVPRVVLSAIAALAIMHNQVSAAQFDGVYIDRGRPLREATNVVLLQLSILGGLSFARFLGRERINATLKTLPLIGLILAMIVSSITANACRINLSGACDCDRSLALPMWEANPKEPSVITNAFKWWKNSHRPLDEMFNCTATSTWSDKPCRLEMYNLPGNLPLTDIIEWQDKFYDVHDVINLGKFRCFTKPEDLKADGKVYKQKDYPWYILSRHRGKRIKS